LVPFPSLQATLKTKQFFTRNEKMKILEIAARAETRLLEVAVDKEWWDAQTKEYKKLYIKEHPNSKYAKLGVNSVGIPERQKRKDGTVPHSKEAPAKQAKAPVKENKDEIKHKSTRDFMGMTKEIPAQKTEKEKKAAKKVAVVKKEVKQAKKDANKPLKKKHKDETLFISKEDFAQKAKKAVDKAINKKGEVDIDKVHKLDKKLYGHSKLSGQKLHSANHLVKKAENALRKDPKNAEAKKLLSDAKKHQAKLEKQHNANLETHKKLMDSYGSEFKEKHKERVRKDNLRKIDAKLKRYKKRISIIKDTATELKRELTTADPAYKKAIKKRLEKLKMRIERFNEKTRDVMEKRREVENS